MKTHRLYYDDSEMQTFSATVLSCREAADGWRVVLDQTAFYPEGGGQPGDCGTLGGVRVFNTQIEADEIVHICEKPLDVGKTVTGSIDYARRFSYMQQHSGEHIVSGLVNRQFGYENVGFHMGSDMITIDFSGVLTMDELKTVEQQANEAVWKNLPVEITVLTDENKNSVSYRSKKELSGEIRVVSIPGYDVCACCGTHVKYTGQIGLIQIYTCQKFHDGVRVQMLCGQKAYRYTAALLEQNHENSVLLSAKPEQTAKSVEKALDDLAAAKYRIGQLERQLTELIVATNRAENPLIFTDLSADAQRAVADALSKKTSGICAVFCGSDQSGYQYVIAQAGGELKALCQKLNLTLHGRGGGKPGFLQGSVQATRSEIEAFFQGEQI